jgi:predicted CoA-substrate-specific enzyme activase
MLTIGIDVGSITTKAAAIEDDRLLGDRIAATGYDAGKSARAVFEALLADLGLPPAAAGCIVATGYGRGRVGFAGRTVTEITCHAAGAHFLNPAVRAVIDIGGQDSKVIALGGEGQVRDFAMNDKCAAGTGRFLEVMARALEVDLDRFGEMAHRADRPAAISSLCTVFAESEVISLIAQGESRPNIIAGIHASVAARVAAMAGRIGLADPVMMTGGVSRNAGLVAALEQKLGRRLEVSGKAQVTGAIGAAVIGRKGRGAAGRQRPAA